MNPYLEGTVMAVFFIFLFGGSFIEQWRKKHICTQYVAVIFIHAIWASFFLEVWVVQFIWTPIHRVLWWRYSLSVLFELPFFGEYDVNHNARWRRRIRSVSNPTSSMDKHMNYISGMAEKTTAATIIEGIYIIHRKLKKKIHINLYTEGTVMVVFFICAIWASFFWWSFVIA